MLDDQTRMELLISGLSDEAKQSYKDASGKFLEFQTWGGVRLDEDTGKIYGFEIPYGTHGTVAFEHLPESVTEFEAHESEIEGTVPVALLPRGLVVFDLSNIQTVSGTIDFCALPLALEFCKLSENEFTGTADLAKLPEGLQSLHIDMNNFEGSVSLANLPASLEMLDISNNNARQELSFFY